MRAFTSVLLLLIGLASLGWAILCFTTAKSAVHEIEGLIAALIVTVVIAVEYAVAAADERHESRAVAPQPGGYAQQQYAQPPVVAVSHMHHGQHR